MSIPMVWEVSGKVSVQPNLYPIDFLTGKHPTPSMPKPKAAIGHDNHVIWSITQEIYINKSYEAFPLASSI